MEGRGEQMPGGKVLILSDGKPGHLNQSLAYARLLGKPYEIRRVAFKFRIFKALSYFFDRMGLLTERLFSVEGELCDFDEVVSAGSTTYYPNRVIARKHKAAAIAIMLPRGYLGSFDLIIAQAHDNPPVAENILVLPVNLSYPQPLGLVKRSGKGPCVAFIVGGPSRHFRMEAGALAAQIEQIFRLFPEGEFYVTTSPRTPPDIDQLIEKLPFDYRVVFSREPRNPIADFLELADYVFVTEDSTSMISDAVTFGRACVEVLPLPATGEKNKVARMIQSLQDQGCLHLYDGTLGGNNRKIKLKEELDQVVRRLGDGPSS